MTISLLIDTAGGSNFEGNDLRNVNSLHVGGSALATETLSVTGTVGISSTLKVDTISEFTGAAGVTVGVDLLVANGFGIVVGHTAQITVQDTAEFQLLGTGGADTNLLIGRFSAAAAGVRPTIQLMRSRAAIGSFATVETGDALGDILFFGDDGTDYATESAQILVTSEGTIGTGRVPSKIEFRTGTDASSTVITTALVIDSAQQAVFTNNVTADAFLASADNSGALGASGTAFADLFLASGAVINFNAGDITLTHTANVLTVAGGTFATAALTATTGVFAGVVTITADAGETLTLSKDSGPNILFKKTTATAQDWTLAGEGSAFKIVDVTDSSAVPLSIAAGTQIATFSASISVTTSVSTAVPNTVAGTGLMVTTNDGSIQEIMRDSSSARFKENIEDAVIDAHAVLSINTKRYNRRGVDGSYLGFIVEDFDNAGFGDIIAYDAEGPAGFLEFGRGITALHHSVLQTHDDRIKELETEIGLLKAA
jgi:hypothetical protein